MKKLILIVASIFMVMIACNSQNNSKSYMPSLLKYVKKDGVNIKSFSVAKDNNKFKFYVPYYEFYVPNIKIGSACLFAVSKTYPQKWAEMAINNPTGECEKKDGYKETFYITCEARRLLGIDTINLKKEFDVYVFFVDKKDLEGPFIETSEGGSSENYFPKKGGTIITYKLIDENWVEIHRDKLLEENITRAYGSEIVKKIAEKKIADYLQNK